MTIRNEGYLRSEENKMYNDKEVSNELDALLRGAKNALNKNTRVIKQNQEMKCITNSIATKIINIQEDICSSIPDNVGNMRKSKIPGYKLSTQLSDKINMVNNSSSTMTLVLKTMKDGNESSKKDLQTVSNNIDKFINQYKEGKIIVNKDSIRELTTAKETLNQEYLNITKLDQKYSQYMEKAKKMELPKSLKDLVEPDNLEFNLRGMYLPTKLKSFIEVKSDFNRYSQNDNLQKQVSEYEKKHKSFIELKNDRPYKARLKAYLEKSILNKKNEELLLNIDSKSMLNFIISERVSTLIDAFERDTTRQNCFFKQIRGYEKPFEEMLNSLRDMEKQLKLDDKQLTNYTDKIEKITKSNEKAQKAEAKELLNVSKPEKKETQKEKQLVI